MALARPVPAGFSTAVALPTNMAPELALSLIVTAAPPNTVIASALMFCVFAPLKLSVMLTAPATGAGPEPAVIEAAPVVEMVTPLPPYTSIVLPACAPVSIAATVTLTAPVGSVLAKPPAVPTWTSPSVACNVTVVPP